MNDKKFTVTYVKTINLGNYESEKIGLIMEFDQGEVHPINAFNRVKSLVEDMMVRREES